MEVASPIPKKHARIEIIPLIDIMFFLLASFMMVSITQTTMKGMKVALPSGTSGESQSKKDYVSFSINKDGFIFFDKNPINYEDVPNILRPIYATRPDAKIFIRGDEEALHGNVTRLLDLIRSTGYTKLAFEIKSEAAKGIPTPQ